MSIPEIARFDGPNSSSGGWNITPPTDALAMVVGNAHAVGGGTSEGAAQLDAIDWDGFNDPSEPLLHIDTEVASSTNSGWSSLWYLVLPDVSGQGTLTWSNSVGDGHSAVWWLRKVDVANLVVSSCENTTTTGSGISCTPPSMIDNHLGLFCDYGQDVTGVISGCTGNSVGTPRVWGHRTTAGAMGHNGSGGRHTVVAASIDHVKGGNQTIVAFSERFRENWERIFGGGIDERDRLWKPEPGLLLPAAADVKALA